MTFRGQKTSMNLEFNQCQESENTSMSTLEHVQLVISLNYTKRGDSSLYLTSPRGTRSQLLPARPLDTTSDGLVKWTFMSLHFWGEHPLGTWTIDMWNAGKIDNFGFCSHLELIFYGTLS